MKTRWLVMFVFIAQLCFGQNYVRLDDASGFNTDPYQTELIEAADSLLAVFPSEFQSQFKVFDFGFYLHNEDFEEGLAGVFEKVIQDAEQLSSYYLLFGKQTDANGIYTKFWVDLKLPSTGDFSCMDLISSTLRESLVKKYEISTN